MTQIAGVQMDIAWEHPAENFRRAEALTEKAVDEGARLVVLPEMFATGFSMNAELVPGFAEETRAFLSDLSTRLATFILAGLSEPDNPMPANVALIFDPAGREVLKYRKIHPFSLAGEDEHFLAGERVETVEVESVRVTPLICYDLRFPEPFRVAAAKTDLFCVIANWPRSRRQHWSALLKARAIENQVFVLGVNRTGIGDGLEYTGDSVLLHPMGEELATVEAGSTGCCSGEVDALEVTRIRKEFSFLKDRRPEVFRESV
jgi:predicted amidohydrolase